MEEKELVRSKIDIVALVGEVVTLKRAGANWKGLCPFHHEKSPSFMVNPELGIFKCFGCGEGGDCFAWIMKMENVDFGEALKMLAERAGVQLTGGHSAHQDLRKDRMYEILSEASRFFRYLLLSHEVGQPVLAYLAKRGISREAIDTFGLGCSLPSWDGLSRVLLKKGFTYQEMELAGLAIRTDTGRFYDRFRGRLMFDLHDARGRVVGLAGRVLQSDDTGPKYMNSPETEIYHKGSLLYGLHATKKYIRQSGRVVLVEGEIDAISSWQVGIKEVVALKGTALTDDQVHLLARYASVVVIALDMDVAGDKASRRSMQLLEDAGIEVRMVRIPSGKDPDDMAREHPAEWQSLIHEAIDVYEFLLLSAMDRFDVGSARGKKKIVDELLPVYSQIPHEIVRNHWLGELSRRVGVDVRILTRQLSGQIYHEQKLPAASVVKKETRREYLVSVCLGCALMYEPSWLQDDLLLQKFAEPWMRETIDIFLRHGAIWRNQLPDSLRQQVEELLLLVQGEDFLSSEFRMKLQEELKSLIKKDLLLELSLQLREAEARNDTIGMNQLLTEIERLRLR